MSIVIASVCTFIVSFGDTYRQANSACRENEKKN